MLSALIVGDSGTGKTAFVTRYASNVFDVTAPPTIGIDYRASMVKVGGRDVKIQIYDSSGNDKFQVITTSYYRRVHFIIVVFDTTNHHSFQNLPKWFHRIKQYAAPAIPIILLGTKVDLFSTRTVSVEEATDFAKAQHVDYIEVSSKSNFNLETCLHNTIEHALIRPTTPTHSPMIVLTEDDPPTCTCST